MTEHKITFSQRLIGIIGSQKFFWIIIGLLIVQAGWIALSSRYPMAFDEDFHLGIIRLYAHHIAPFWGGQPESADRFGAVARDPSYLYHYLFSFPYRLISLFTTNQTVQVLLLRMMNIGLFTSSIIMFRRIFQKTGISQPIIHATLLAFVLLPIVPLLAAQINYDNVILPMTALAILITISFDSSLAKHRFVNIKELLELLIVCLLASLVKYAFLPIFAGIICFIIFRLWQAHNLKDTVTLRPENIVKQLRCLRGAILVIAAVLAAGLFAERYGLNLVHYHTPVPDCSQVLRVEQCKEYGPWIRDHELVVSGVHDQHGFISYNGLWIYGMWLRTFFTVGGPSTDFETRGPLLLPGLSALFLAGLGLASLIVAGPRLFKTYKKSVLWLFIVVSVGYISVLWLDELRVFIRTGQPIAINGRYLLPVLLPVMLIAAAGIAEFLRGQRNIKLLVAITGLLCLAWGGGTLTFILRSNDRWYWPNPVVRTLNNDLRSSLGRITPGFYSPAQFLP